MKHKKHTQPKISLLDILILLLSVVIGISIGRNRIYNSLQAANKPTATLTYDLYNGYNAISFPFIGSHSASDLCDQIPGSFSISKYQKNDWVTYECANSDITKNFKIFPTTGYFIRMNAAYTWTTEGILFDEPYKLNLTSGWNFTTIYIPENELILAENICARTVNINEKIIEIDRWYNGGWNAHICGLPFNNFSISKFSPYFIKVDKITVNNAKESLKPVLPQ